MKRRENESYEDYRVRRIAAAKALKQYLKGTLITANAFPRSRARGEMQNRGTEFRERVRQTQQGVKQRVESHRKMGG